MSKPRILSKDEVKQIEQYYVDLCPHSSKELECMDCTRLDSLFLTINYLFIQVETLKEDR